MTRDRFTILPPLFLIGVGFSLLAAAAPAQDAALSFNAETHAREVEEWRAARIEGLQKPDGWFSLVGLAWLEEGANTIGSAADSVVAMPEKAPVKVGAFHLAEGHVQFAAAPGIEVTHDGKPVKWLELDSDASGEATVLETGSFLFHVIERGGRTGVRVKDRESPARAAFEGIETYPTSLDWRIVGRLEPHDPPRTVAVPNVLGTVNDSPSPGSVVFETDGREHRLDALPGGEDELFMVFGDQTNGDTTYGGGRFLYAKIVAGRVVLDFNKAYSPPCAFTTFATCPLPPKQNRLAIRVEAGEKNYGAHH